MIFLTMVESGIDPLSCGTWLVSDISGVRAHNKLSNKVGITPPIGAPLPEFFTFRPAKTITHGGYLLKV